MSAVQLRVMGPSDVRFVLEHMIGEGWAATPSRVRTHLEHDPNGCFIALLGKQPVGLVTTTRFRRCAWIGNLIVSPEVRRLGIGTQLIQHCLTHLSAAGVRTIRLEADPLGEGIYRREGFVDECVSRRLWIGRAHGQNHTEVRPLAATELEGVAAFDAASFGDDRARLLRLCFDQAELRLTLGPVGSWRGYAMLVPTQSGTQLGPCVAADPSAARALVETALAYANGAVVLGVPEPNQAAVELYESLGFLANPSSLRMIRGPAESGGILERVYALASGACG